MKSSPNKRWLTAISQIAKACAKQPGHKAALIKKMDTIAPADTGKPWNRQQIDGWLHPDPKQRHEPRIGVGLALMEAAKKLNNKTKL